MCALDTSKLETGSENEPTMSKKYTIQGVQCSKCGDEIFSMSRHDFVRCSCGETFTDGGGAYLRAGGSFAWDGDKVKIVKRQSDAPQKEEAW